MLHLNHNKLKKIPEAIGNLQMLQTLNLSHNSLKDLPDTLSNLSRLKTFDISYNPKLKKLPKSLAKCHAIEKFSVTDGNAIQYPPSDICQNGAKTDWTLNYMSGCVCSDTGYYGWYCERPNTELCEYVDGGGELAYSRASLK